MRSRGRPSLGAVASKISSTCSAQSAAHAATVRRSASLSVCGERTRQSFQPDHVGRPAGPRHRAVPGDPPTTRTCSSPTLGGRPAAGSVCGTVVDGVGGRRHCPLYHGGLSGLIEMGRPSPASPSTVAATGGLSPWPTSRSPAWPSDRRRPNPRPSAARGAWCPRGRIQPSRIRTALVG